MKDAVQNEAKSYYVLFRYAPTLLDKDVKCFEDLYQYKVFESKRKLYTEDYCANWLFEKKVSKAVTMLLEHLDDGVMNDMYQEYAKKAKEDPKYIKHFLLLKEVLFSDSSVEDELISILKGTTIEKTDRMEALENFNEDEGDFE